MPVDVHVVTPEREVWSGESDLVIARGTDGEVGIMAGHMPLLVRLAVGPLRIQRSEGELRMAIDGGFLHVASHDGVTRVDVMADGAIEVSEIDVAAEQARADAAAVAAAADETDEQAKRDLASAQTRLTLTQ